MLPIPAPAIRGTFLGWRIEFNGKKHEFDDPEEVRRFFQDNLGPKNFYSRFTNGHITEVQPGYDLKHIPNTPAHKYPDNQRWVMGMPVEDIHHCAHGAD
jgi:hypothetical protein